MDKKNLTIIFLTTLMAVMGVASISPAFPSIVEHFNLSPTQVTLLITVFTFPGIFLSPVAGVLADRLGRKTILLPSLLLFGIAGLGCFFTNDWKILLVLRFFQGIGAAPLGSLNVTLIGDLFSGEKRGEVMGYNVSVLSTGTALFPFIGGTLAMAGWQYPFALPILAIPTALLAIFWLKNPEPKKQQNLKKYLISTWKIINQKTVWGLFIINVLVFVVLYGAILSYLPQLMAERFQSSSFQIGLFTGGFSIITAITSSQIKWINRKIKPKKTTHHKFYPLYNFDAGSVGGQCEVATYNSTGNFRNGSGNAFPWNSNTAGWICPLKRKGRFYVDLQYGAAIGANCRATFYWNILCFWRSWNSFYRRCADCINYVGCFFFNGEGLETETRKITR